MNHDPDDDPFDLVFACGLEGCLMSGAHMHVECYTIADIERAQAALAEGQQEPDLSTSRIRELEASLEAATQVVNNQSRLIASLMLLKHALTAIARHACACRQAPPRSKDRCPVCKARAALTVFAEQTDPGKVAEDEVI